MRTGAGIFLVLAGGALFEVKVELLSHCLGTFLFADLDYGGEIVAFRDDLVGDELVAVFGEAQLGRSRAVAEGDADDLLAGGDDFHVVIDEADFDFLIFVDEELDVGFDFGDEATARGASNDFVMVVVVFIFVGSVGSEGHSKGEQGGGKQLFHGVCVCFVCGLGLPQRRGIDALSRLEIQ